MKSSYLLHHCLSSAGFFLSLLGFILPKIMGVLVALFISIYLGQSIWVYLLTAISFFIIQSIFYPIAKYVTGKGLLLSNYSWRFKFSYIAKYGQDYKHPNFFDYSLKPKEYYAYNRRFTINSQFFSFLSMPIVLILLVTQTHLKGLEAIFSFLVIAITFSLILNYLIKTINLYFSKKWTQHDMVREYKNALQIYEKIQEEIKANQNAFIGWNN